LAKARVTGHPIAGFEQRGDRVIARFADRLASRRRRGESDILIGPTASIRRCAAFYPGKGVFDGYLHYRGTMEATLFTARDGGVAIAPPRILYPIIATPAPVTVQLARLHRIRRARAARSWTPWRQAGWVDRFDG